LNTKVENIAEGTRIVLQFDLNVEGNEDDYALDTDDEEDDINFLERGSGERVSTTMNPLFPLSAPDPSRDIIL
jgi:hypothetical protein